MIFLPHTTVPISNKFPAFCCSTLWPYVWCCFHKRQELSQDQCYNNVVVCRCLDKLAIYTHRHTHVFCQPPNPTNIWLMTIPHLIANCYQVSRVESFSPTPAIWVVMGTTQTFTSIVFSNNLPTYKLSHIIFEIVLVVVWEFFLS